MTDKKIRVGILGVSGYGGGELARIVAQHPCAALSIVTSNSQAGQPLKAAFAGRAKQIESICEKFDFDQVVSRCDVVFMAGEAGLAMDIAPQLLQAGKKVIDLSADFRLQNPEDFQKWYKLPHTATAWLAKAVYGLPELNRDKIKGAQLVANPGCYPTSALLALMPLLQKGLIEPDSLIIDSYSGVSGAGRFKFGLDFHFAEVNESLKPYAVGGVHRHVPEIEQMLSIMAGHPVVVTFTPHLAPISRGILTTAYANLTAAAKTMDTDALSKIYQEHYAREPFVVVKAPQEHPATKHVVGSNMCHVSATVDARTGRVVITSALDNLVKGMTGQAVQNMNLMCGLDETTGLAATSLWP